MRYIFRVKDPKQIKKLLVVFGIITGCFFVFIIVNFMILKYQQSNWSLETAVVTDYDVSNSNDVWTELSYTCNQRTYISRIKGHSYWMREGEKVIIYCNPSNPEEIKMEQNMGTGSKVLFLVCLIFGGFTLVFLFYYLNLVRDQKKYLV